MRYYHICFSGNSEAMKNDEEIERIIGRSYGSLLYPEVPSFYTKDYVGAGICISS